ncbi:MAG: penicillin-insensitive murein endopeptidase [Pseudolabrys sp.]
MVEWYQDAAREFVKQILPPMMQPRTCQASAEPWQSATTRAVVFKGGSNCPTTGPTWQAMRVSRNRNWGHPELVQFLERFAPLAAEATGWKGILIGDMAQPRGVRNITAMSSR